MSIIDRLIFCIAFFLLLAVWKEFDHIKKLRQQQNLFQKIGWIAEKDNRNMVYSEFVRLRDYDLLSYIIEEQHNLNIPKQFCIDYSNETQKKYAEEILNLHKDDVIKLYFSDFLTKSKNICKLNSLEYYFYSLYCFIYKELKEYRHYQDKIYFGEKYTDNTHFSCKLTDFGRTYYKLYLISLMFIEGNEHTRKLFEYIDPKLKNRLMGYLENNEVVFWSYRP